jgi:hypothetical protein
MATEQWDFLKGVGASDSFGHKDLEVALSQGKTKQQVIDYLDAQNKAGQGFGAVGWAKNKAGQQAGTTNVDAHGRTVWDILAPAGSTTSNQNYNPTAIGSGSAADKTTGAVAGAQQTDTFDFQGALDQWKKDWQQEQAAYQSDWQDQMKIMQDQYTQQQQEMMRQQQKFQLEQQRRQEMVRTAAPSVVKQNPVMGIQASAQAQGTRGMSAADWSRTAPIRSKNVGLNV